MTDVLDLLGDPVRANHGMRGRPQHVPTKRNRLMVNMLLGLDWGIQEIANALRIDEKTLHRYYFRELEQVDAARDALKADNLLHLYAAAKAGKVAAIKEMLKKIERDELEDLAKKLSAGRRELKPAPLGKKEQAAVAANQVSGKYAPPPAPIFVN